MSAVFPFPSRRGSSVQHSHRKHSGCRKARGRVLQDEKCKNIKVTQHKIFTVLTVWYKFTPINCPHHHHPYQMFQVIQPERALYIQANNCVEARDWIDILTKVSQCNRKRLSTYHPSAYLNGHWLCCKLSADTAPGCTPCTEYVKLPKCVQDSALFLHSFFAFHSSCMCFSGLPANIQLDIDGDRETERIYSLFSTYMNKLINMQGQTPWESFFPCMFNNNFFFKMFHVSLCSFLQRPVAVSLCTTGPNKRSTPALSSTTRRRPTKP